MKKPVEEVDGLTDLYSAQDVLEALLESCRKKVRLQTNQFWERAGAQPTRLGGLDAVGDILLMLANICETRAKWDTHDLQAPDDQQRATAFTGFDTARRLRELALSLAHHWKNEVRRARRALWREQHPGLFGSICVLGLGSIFWATSILWQLFHRV